MPSFISSTFVLARNQDHIWDFGSSLAVQNVGARITGPVGPDYRRWGWLWLRVQSTFGSSSFETDIPVGAVWRRATEYRMPVNLNRRFVVFRSAKDVPIGGTLQLFAVTL